MIHSHAHSSLQITCQFCRHGWCQQPLREAMRCNNNRETRICKSSSVVCRFTFKSLLATALCHHLLSKVWTNRHLASSTGISRHRPGLGQRSIGPSLSDAICLCHLFLQAAGVTVAIDGIDSTDHQRYPEIWPRTVTIDAPGFTLAWHSWASQLQTLSTDTSMSPREGSSVPVGLLHTGIPSCCTTAPAFSRSSPAGGSATLAQHVRPSDIRGRWPDDLQSSARWAVRPQRQHNNFQTTFKDALFSRAIYTSSALEVKT